MWNWAFYAVQIAKLIEFMEKPILAHTHIHIVLHTERLQLIGLYVYQQQQQQQNANKTGGNTQTKSSSHFFPHANTHTTQHTHTGPTTDLFRFIFCYKNKAPSHTWALLVRGTFAYYDPHSYFIFYFGKFYWKNKAAVRVRDYIWRPERYLWKVFRLFPVVIRYFF